MSINDIILLIFILLTVLSLIFFMLILLFYKQRKTKIIGYSITLSTFSVSLIVFICIFSLNYNDATFLKRIDNFQQILNDENKIKLLENQTNKNVNKIKDYINDLAVLDLFSYDGEKYYVGKESCFYINTNNKISDVFLIDINIEVIRNHQTNETENEINLKFKCIGSYQVKFNGKIKSIAKIDNYFISNLIFYFNANADLKNKTNTIYTNLIQKVRTSKAEKDKEISHPKFTYFGINGGNINYVDIDKFNISNFPTINQFSLINVANIEATNMFQVFPIHYNDQVKEYGFPINELFYGYKYNLTALIEEANFSVTYYNSEYPYNYNLGIKFDIIFDNTSVENFGLVKKGKIETLKTINRMYYL